MITMLYVNNIPKNPAQAKGPTEPGVSSWPSIPALQVSACLTIIVIILLLDMAFEQFATSWSVRPGSPRRQLKMFFFFIFDMKIIEATI